jgi:hypothetical protein
VCDDGKQVVHLGGRDDIMRGGGGVRRSRLDGTIVGITIGCMCLSYV